MLVPQSNAEDVFSYDKQLKLVIEALLRPLGMPSLVSKGLAGTEEKVKNSLCAIFRGLQCQCYVIPFENRARL